MRAGFVVLGFSSSIASHHGAASFGWAVSDSLQPAFARRGDFMRISCFEKRSGGVINIHGRNSTLC